MTRSILSALAALLLVAPAAAVDLASFEFNDPNGTPLTGAANSANPGNFWFYDEEATVPGDETTGDTSTIQSGNYRIITDSSFAAGLDSRYLDIANTSSGTVYLSATFSSWAFGAYDGSTEEQVRFTFLDDDTGTSGSSVTAQVQVRRNPDSGSMELFGDAIGTAGSFDIANTVDLPDSKSSPFTMVLAVDKDSNSFEVFYKDGSSPSQALGLGGVSRARDVNSVRMVTNNFGAENFLPFVITEEARLDRFVVSDTNPLTDLITLEIDRTTGQATLINNSGAAVTGVTSITLESATSSIDAAELAGFSGTLGSGQTVPLDGMPGTAAGPWRLNPIEDVRAELVLSGGGVRTLDVNFVANSGLKWVSGDLDFDGVIDADDYTILSANSETDLSGLGAAAAYQRGDLNGDGFNDVIDFSAFKDTFIAANGAPAFARLIAGVPEPGSACLVLLAGLGLAVRRRRPASVSPQENNRTMIQTAPKRISLFVLFALIATAQPAQAVIFEEFLFNDTAGTLYTSVANNANPGNLWDEDADTIDVTTNGLGQLDASQKANTGFGTNYIDINPGITTGLIYGVLELTWDFQSALDTAENEEIRLSFINADPRSTAITAQYQITRTDADILELNGSAIGTGASNITATTLNGGSLTQTDKFIAVLAADLDNDSYEVLYSNNAGSSFSLLGSGAMDPTRGIEAIRLTLNNDLSDDNVLIDRFYLADELPIVVEPDLLTLRVHPKSGFVALANATEAAFDIDYYRVKSEDDSLLTDGWNSLQSRGLDAVDGPDADSVAGDSAGETWTEAGGSDASVLSESFLLSSTQIGSDDSISLGRAVDLAGDESLLEFEYREATNGNVFTGLVEVAEGLPGDFNLDGSVDAADYTVFRDNASGLFVPVDYTVWATNYGTTSATSTTTSIPEPMALELLVVVFGLSLRRRFLAQ